MSPHIEQMPEVRQIYATAQRQARIGLAKLFHDIDAAVDEKAALQVGSFHYAVMTGVLAQWLVDPEQAPSARDLAVALRIITAGMKAPGADRDRPG